jgi:MoxR-like ATPase
MTNATKPATIQVYLHEVFGFKNPIEGFEKPIRIAAERHPFCPEVNRDYVFSEDMVARLLGSYAARENIMLIGEKGTGKSSMVEQFCARLNLPLMVINGGPGLDETHLMGCKTIESGTVKSVDGDLSYCIRHGIPVLIDEIATIKPSVLVSINDVLNGNKVITLKHHGIDPTMTPAELARKDGSMVIQRHPEFRLFATDNTGGKVGKDPRYAGVATQNSAVRSRFTTFKVGFLKPAQELKALVGATGGKLPIDTAKSMVEFAIRVRANFELGEMYDTVSFRELQRWARKTLVYGNVHTAFVDAIYTAMEESDQVVAAEIFDLAIGSKLELPNEYASTAQSFLAELDQGGINWDAA